MYEKLGGLHTQNDSGGDAAAAYVEAAKCYQKTNKTGARPALLSVQVLDLYMLSSVRPADVVRVLHKAIEYYTENGRLGQAARQLRVRSLLTAAAPISCGKGTSWLAPCRRLQRPWRSLAPRRSPWCSTDKCAASMPRLLAVLAAADSVPRPCRQGTFMRGRARPQKRPSVE